MNESFNSSGSAIVGLINPKNATNVGAVIRAAHCFSAHRILYTGPRYDRSVRYCTDTKNAANTLPMQHTDNLFEQIPTSVKIVCIELAIGATPLPDFEHPTDAAYVFGPEDGTLSQATIDKADSVVFIPSTSSLNLAASVNVVLYDRQAKRSTGLSLVDYDQLIRQSRDCRNRLKVDR